MGKDQERYGDLKVNTPGEKSWVRRRWRSDEDSKRCVRCEASINRPDAYYVRPAYTDGRNWMCVPCFDRMTKAATGSIDHRYGYRKNSPNEDGS